MSLRTMYDKFLEYRIVNNEDARLFEVMRRNIKEGQDVGTSKKWHERREVCNI
jgi:hypothetical protein